jgi:hypothetical protein
VSQFTLGRLDPRLSVAKAIAEVGAMGSKKMKGLIAVALIVCATFVLVAVAIIRHVDNKRNAAWCYENGYTNYATNDGFCVGAGGKLKKVGL